MSRRDPHDRAVDGTAEGTARTLARPAHADAGAAVEPAAVAGAHHRHGHAGREPRQEPDRKAADDRDGRRRARAEPGGLARRTGHRAQAAGRRSRCRDPQPGRERLPADRATTSARTGATATPALVEIVHDSTRQDADIPVKRVENALETVSPAGRRAAPARARNQSRHRRATGGVAQGPVDAGSAQEHGDGRCCPTCCCSAPSSAAPT